MTDSSLPPGGRATPRAEYVDEVDQVVHRGRRGLGGWWWGALLGVPLALSLVSAAATHSGVEADLTNRVTAALTAGGVTPTTVSFSGRDGALTIPPAQADAARVLAGGVPGVRVVTLGSDAGAAAASTPTPTTPATTTATTSAPTVADGVFSASSSGDGTSIDVTAVVPDEAAKTALLATFAQAAPQATIVDHVSVAAGAPAIATTFQAGLAAAVAAAPGAEIVVEGTTVTLTGTVASADVKESLAQAASGLVAGAAVSDQVTVAAGPTACPSINTEVAAYLKAHPIRFATGSASLTAASKADLLKVAKRLKGCIGVPGGATAVTVAGHTDGDGDPARNLTLSSARASSVKTALVADGLPARLVTATGYGESRPIATNTTAAGKAANRRVEIRLS